MAKMNEKMQRVYDYFIYVRNNSRQNIGDEKYHDLYEIQAAGFLGSSHDGRTLNALARRGLIVVLDNWDGSAARTFCNGYFSDDKFIVQVL